MVRIRPFRNNDPPALAALWNDACTGRGSYPLRSPVPFDRCVLAKPYFDPDGLLVAEDDKEVVGFAHAGFGSNDQESALDSSRGVLCAIAVRTSHRRRGIGSALLRQAEQYVRARGTTIVHAGPHWPLSPFYFGLYGGSDLPGFLVSDAEVGPFLEHHGYQIVGNTIVLQRKLDKPIVVTDPRFMAHRRRYEVRAMPRTSVGTWWQECVAGLLEAVEFRLEDRMNGQFVARAPVWEMEGQSARWQTPVAGVTDVQVRADLRRQGLAKFLVTQVLRGLQEQFFGIVEVQTAGGNESGLAFFQSLGFDRVDLGLVYRRSIGGSGLGPPSS